MVCSEGAREDVHCSPQLSLFLSLSRLVAPRTDSQDAAVKSQRVTKIILK